MDNNLLYRLVKVRDKLGNLELNTNKKVLKRNALTRRMLTAHVGSVVKDITGIISLMPKSYKINDVDVSRLLRTTKITGVSIVQSLNDKEIKLSKAIKIGRDIQARLKDAKGLLDSDISGRQAVASDLETVILRGKITDLSEKELEREASQIIANNKLAALAADKYKPKTVGFSFHVLQEINLLKREADNSQNLLNMLQNKIDPSVEPTKTEEIKSPPKPVTTPLSGKGDESLVRMRATLAMYHSLLPKPAVIKAEIEKDDIGKPEEEKHRGFAILTKAPVLVYTTPYISAQRLKESRIKGINLQFHTNSSRTDSNDGGPYNDGMAQVSMGSNSLGTILENQIIIGISAKLPEAERSETVDVAKFAAENRFGPLTIIELGNPSRKLSDFTVSDRISTKEEKLKSARESIPAIVKYPNPQKPDLPKNPSAQQREIHAQEMLRYKQALIKHLATNPPSKLNLIKPQQPVRPIEPKFKASNPPVAPKRPDLTKAKNPKELEKKYKAAYKEYKAASADYQEELNRIEAARNQFNIDLKNYKKAEDKYRKDLEEYNAAPIIYERKYKEHLAALEQYKNSDEFKNEVSNRNKAIKDISRIINQKNKAVEKEHERESSRMQVLKRSSFFANKHFPGVLFILLMRNGDYKHFSGIKFQSINFPYAEDLSSTIEERTSKQILQEKQMRDAERIKPDPLKQARLEKNKFDLSIFQPQKDALDTELQNLKKELSDCRKRIEDNQLQLTHLKENKENIAAEMARAPAGNSGKLSTQQMAHNLTLQQITAQEGRIEAQIEFDKQVIEISLKRRQRELDKSIKQLKEIIIEKLRA